MAIPPGQTDTLPVLRVETKEEKAALPEQVARTSLAQSEPWYLDPDIGSSDLGLLRVYAVSERWLSYSPPPWAQDKLRTSALSPARYSIEILKCFIFQKINSLGWLPHLLQPTGPSCCPSVNSLNYKELFTCFVFSPYPECELCEGNSSSFFLLVLFLQPRWNIIDTQ